jgi:uncharacterized protein (DUF433 family)
MKDRSGRRDISIWSFPDVHGGEPVLWGTLGARVVDLLDRIDAGDSIEEVAKDFLVDGESLELLVELRAALLEDTEREREEWRGKAENRLNEWRLRDQDAKEAEHDRDEAIAAKEMWRLRALQAERALASTRPAVQEAP